MSDNPKEREAFEAWLNPGHHTQNVSPWVEPGRYEKESHQLAWLAWCAAIEADRVSRDVPADLAAVLLELDTPIAGLLGSHSGKFVPGTSKDSKEFDAFESAIPLVRWTDHERTCRKIATLAASPQPQPVQAQPSEAFVLQRTQIIKALEEMSCANYNSAAERLHHAIEQGSEQAQPSTCTWTYQNDDSGNYESSCGELWHFIDGGPNENRVTYCHHCGKSVDVKEE